MSHAHSEAQQRRTHVFEAADRSCLEAMLLQVLPPVKAQDECYKQTREKKIRWDYRKGTECSVTSGLQLAATLWPALGQSPPPSTQGLCVPMHFPWWGTGSYKCTETSPHKRHNILLTNPCCHLLLGKGGQEGQKKGQIQCRAQALQGEWRPHPLSPKPLSSFASRQQHCRLISAALASLKGARKIRVKHWDINPIVTPDPRLLLCSSSSLPGEQFLLRSPFALTQQLATPSATVTGCSSS